MICRLFSRSLGGCLLKIVRQDFWIAHDLSIPMRQPSDSSPSPLRRHAADALRRARKLPVGPHRNDLRQLAIGLLWLDKNSGKPAVYETALAQRSAVAVNSDFVSGHR
jgi:hypothetical protein